MINSEDGDNDNRIREQFGKEEVHVNEKGQIQYLKLVNRLKETEEGNLNELEDTDYSSLKKLREILASAEKTKFTINDIPEVIHLLNNFIDTYWKKTKNIKIGKRDIISGFLAIFPHKLARARDVKYSEIEIFGIAEELLKSYTTIEDREAKSIMIYDGLENLGWLLWGDEKREKFAVFWHENELSLDKEEIEIKKLQTDEWWEKKIEGLLNKYGIEKAIYKYGEDLVNNTHKYWCDFLSKEFNPLSLLKGQN